MRGIQKEFFLALFFVFVAVFAFVFYFDGNHVNAATQELHGWAWSSNIGWVGFNCADVSACGTTNYKVIFESTTGDISGYVWSSSIGWINFDPDLTNAPDGSGSARVSNLGTGQVDGWIRACSVFDSGCSGVLKGTAERGGWDGWVKLSGTDHISPDLTGAGGVTFDVANNKFVGFAWGGDVIGWLNFDQVTLTALPPLPAADIKANGSDAPPPISSGSSATITWCGSPATPCVNADSCTVAPTGWSGTSGTQSTGSLISSQTYTLTCTNAVGSSVDSVTVTVAAANAPPVADAGPDQSSTVGSPYSHTGGIVTDSNGNLASYDWDFISCPGACPADPAPVSVSGGSASASLTYTPTVAGTYTLRLRATDTDALTSTDTAVDTAGGAGGGFTLSAIPSSITIDASSFFYSFSSRSEITVIPSGGYSGDVQLSVAGVSPTLPTGFLDLYTPNDVISLAEYGGGTFFKARVETSVADPNVDKTFIITLRGVDTVNSAITDDVDVTLIIRASDPGGGEQ